MRLMLLMLFSLLVSTAHAADAGWRLNIVEYSAEQGAKPIGRVDLPAGQRSVTAQAAQVEVLDIFSGDRPGTLLLVTLRRDEEVIKAFVPDDGTPFFIKGARGSDLLLFAHRLAPRR